jgi:hypothetical protein
MKFISILYDNYTIKILYLQYNHIAFGVWFCVMDGSRNPFLMAPIEHKSAKIANIVQPDLRRSRGTRPKEKGKVEY